MADNDPRREGTPDHEEEEDAGGKSALHVASEGESWRFSLSDLDESEGLTRGSPDAEHVVFVLLGAAVTLAVLSQFLL